MIVIIFLHYLVDSLIQHASSFSILIFIDIFILLHALRIQCLYIYVYIYIMCLSILLYF